MTPAPGPVRTCIGCRERAQKFELLRVVAGAGADGQPAVRPDPDGRAPGRGAHLHPTTECLDRAVRRRAFNRALRVTVALPGGLSVDLLREHLEQRDRSTTERNRSSSS
jgi:predicted RNA-binding protein YlxR (DUF448 family)